MSKQWYFQVMGAEVGPLSPVQLKEKVKLGQVQAETLVRLGTDGKWQTADRVKGLLDPPPAPAKPPAAEPAVPDDAIRIQGAPPSADVHPHPREKTYHLEGDMQPHTEDALDDQTDEFDFFRLVGFEQAIGSALHEVLINHCRKHQLSLTQVTRRALAELLGRKDLVADQPAEGPAAESGATAAVGVAADGAAGIS